MVVVVVDVPKEEEGVRSVVVEEGGMVVLPLLLPEVAGCDIVVSSVG